MIAGSVMELVRLRIRCATSRASTDRDGTAARNLCCELRKVTQVVDTGFHATAGLGAICDAVLLIDCIAPTPGPFFVYLHDGKDLEIVSDGVALRQASGVFTESEWMAHVLVEQSGISRGRIHVIRPARLDRGGRMARPSWHRRSPRRNVLYVQCHAGRRLDTWSDLPIAAALEILRREYDPEVALTVLGPRRIEEASTLLDSHDLLVVPPGEGRFGAVIGEALAQGVPCVTSAACEMAEAIVPGVTGVVLGDGDACQLAATIAAALADDQMYQRCRERAPAMAAYFSWERVARQVAHVISQEVALAR